VDDFYAARDNTMPSLPWPSIAPPFTLDLKPSEVFEQGSLNVGRNCHHLLRICGEDQVAHLSKAARQCLRFEENMDTK
jgi:hypothetical protein